MQECAEQLGLRLFRQSPHRSSFGTRNARVYRHRRSQPGSRGLFVDLRPRAVPNLDGKVDWARDGDKFGDELRKRVSELGYPTDVVVERMYDPLDWEALGMERGTPFGLPTRSARPVRSGPTTSTSACPAWCSPCCRRCPVSACRWCSCRASSLPSGSSGTPVRPPSGCATRCHARW